MSALNLRTIKFVLVSFPWIVVIAFGISAVSAGILPILPRWFSLIALACLPVSLGLLVKAKIRQIRELKNSFGTNGMTRAERRYYWAAYALIATAFTINLLINFKT